MPGKFYITASDPVTEHAFSALLATRVDISPHGVPGDLFPIQESDFVLAILTANPDVKSVVEIGYAVGVNKPLIVYLDEFVNLPDVLQHSTYAVVRSMAALDDLLTLLEPLYGLSLLSDKVAETIAIIKEKYGE